MEGSFEFQAVRKRLEEKQAIRNTRMGRSEVGDNDTEGLPRTVHERVMLLDHKLHAEIKEREEDPRRQTEVGDYFLLLREVIQDKLKHESAEEKQEEETRAKLLNELITPELMGQYKEIAAGLKASTEWIDLEDPIREQKIEAWTNGLVAEVRANSPDTTKEDEDELRAHAWMVFQAITNVLNTQIVERDVKKEKANASGDDHHDGYDHEPGPSPDEVKDKIVEALSKRYPMKKDEIEILVQLADTTDEEYNFTILADTIKRTWQHYRPENKKKELVMLSAGHLVQTLLESYTPSLFAKMFPEGGFDIAVFLESFSMERLGNLIGSKLDMLENDIEVEVKKKVNARVANTLFYQSFEFMQEKSQGDIFETLQGGRDATLEILRDTATRLAPIVGSVFASLGFLTVVNPTLGGIGLAGLPAMYYIATKRKDKFWGMHNKASKESRKHTSKLAAVRDGFEQVRTSSEIPAIAEDFMQSATALDEMHRNQSDMMSRFYIIDNIPRDVTTLASAVAGWAMWHEGLIPGGAVVSNIQYANRLQRPIETLIRLYLRDFPEAVQKIRRMETMFGKYEDLDVPDGEREANRIGVSELPNFAISMRDLSYKRILRGINLEVPPGEFLVIGGESGVGKTTLLRTMIGLYKPADGAVKIGGAELDGIKRFGPDSFYASMAYSNQQPHLFPQMTLRENLLLWTGKDVSDKEIENTLDSLNLGKLKDRLSDKVNFLSGGEKVRFGVARALLKKPKVLILDEPTSSLDSKSATEVRALLDNLHKANPDMTIICVSHDEDLKKIGDRAINLADLQKK